MITIISGTNRKNSKTQLVAKYYFQLLKQDNKDVHLFSLEEIKSIRRDDFIEKIEERLLIPTEKFIIVMPEYNGSFPGILKLLFDNTDIRKVWWYKKALLVGVADGRGGNLRGIEHMTNILHYLKMNVHYNKLPISKINMEMNEKGEFVNELTIQAIKEQVHSFENY